MKRLLFGVALSSCVVASAGCASPLVRAAATESRASFRVAFGAALSKGIGAADLQRVALERGRVELRTADGADGLITVRALSRCASPLEAAFRERAATRDAIGAEAALALLEAGHAEPLEFVSVKALDDPAWLAVAGRSMTLTDDGESFAACTIGWSDCVTKEGSRAARVAMWRRQRFQDGHAAVRLAAVRAAVEASDRRDVPELFDTARRDPEPTVRLLAIEALGKMASSNAVLGLLDAWAQASAAERTAIVRAWTVSVANGGGPHCGGAVEHAGCLAFQRLLRVVDSADGEPLLVAALGVVKATALRNARSALSLGSAEGRAVAAVERAIDSGPTELRVMAVIAAPLQHAALLEAVVEASQSKEPELAAVSFARLAMADTPVTAAEREAAVRALRERARRDDAGTRRALDALVAIRDGDAKALVTRLATSKVGAERRFAADALAWLGASAEALAFATDNEPDVRGNALCAVLESRGRP